MQQSYQEVEAWLQNHVNRTLLIQKIEDGDTDQVEMFLEGSRLGEQMHHDPDDFVADRALLLQGAGKVMTDGEPAELPQAVFEIPLSGECRVSSEGDRLRIKTERASYDLISQQGSQGHH
ncbi:hypothetical protein [Caldalkalibacillus salinus]|uniref:hypothetical protein n=1 Tax=Caldalkalibacillus salinus TaxID=2803787 RepID=UPI0019222382|nr:hypothetical protein [Caldalkalibacillus salinus]